MVFCVFNIDAQNLRRIEGTVKDYHGVPIADATLHVNGTNKTFTTKADGSFVIDIPIYCYAITVTANGYQARFMEIDGTYMLFTLRSTARNSAVVKQKQAPSSKPQKVETKNKVEKDAQLIKQKGGKSKEQARIATQGETKADAKAEEQARIATKKEAEAKAKAKAKAEEQARIAAKKEAEAKAKAEEQARIAAKKEAEAKVKAKAKAEEQARITAQKEAEAKIKAEKQAKLAAEKAAKEELANWLEEQRAKQAELLEQRRATGNYE